MCTNIRKITSIVKRLEFDQHLQYAFLQDVKDYYFFISPKINNYKVDKFKGFKSLLSLFIIRDKDSNEILGYKIRPKGKFMFRKNYMLIYGHSKDGVYNDFTGFPGLQCYFNSDSIMLISNKRTAYYNNIESVL